MGRGHRNQAITEAQQLLYGRNQRGSGPDTGRLLNFKHLCRLVEEGEWPSVFDQQISQQLPILEARLSETSSLSEPVVHLTLSGFGDNQDVEQISYLYLAQDQTPMITLTHSRDVLPGGPQERKLIKEIAKALPQSEAKVVFDINSTAALRAVLENYGADNFQVSSFYYGDRSSESEIISDFATLRLDFEPEQAQLLIASDSFNQLLSTSQGRDVVGFIAAEEGFLISRPLQSF